MCFTFCIFNNALCFLQENFQINAHEQAFDLEKLPTIQITPFWRHQRMAVDLRGHDPREKGSTQIRTWHSLLLFSLNHLLVHIKRWLNNPTEFLLGMGRPNWSWEASMRRSPVKYSSWDPFILITILHSQTRSYVKCLYLHFHVYAIRRAHRIQHIVCIHNYDSCNRKVQSKNSKEKSCMKQKPVEARYSIPKVLSVESHRHSPCPTTTTSV